MVQKSIFGTIVVLCLATSLFANMAPEDEFKKVLSEKQSGDVEAVDAAATKLIQIASGKPDSTKDALLSIFSQYYYDSMKKGFENNSISVKQYPITDAEKEEINARLSKVGWTYKESEGYPYVGELGGWFKDRFSSILTPAFKEYFELRDPEIREGFSEDAGMSISWEQLRNRIINWEKFIKRYPNFSKKNEIQGYLNTYVHTFIFGMDNSRIYDFRTNALYPEVKAAYEKFIKEDNDSQYYVIVKDGYEMLRKRNFIVTQEYYNDLFEKGYPQ